MTKAVLNGSGSQQVDTSGSDDANDTVNAFAGLLGQNPAPFLSTGSSGLHPAFGVPPQVAEAAAHAAALGLAAAASPAPLLSLFALGEYDRVSSGGGTEIIAPTEATADNIAFVNVTVDGTGTYTVASAGFPTGAVGVLSSSQASFSPLPRGSHGGDTFGESFLVKPGSGRLAGLNFYKSSANSHQTNFSLVSFSPANPPAFSKPNVANPLGAVTLNDVKVLGWNSNSILLSFASSIDLHAGDAVGGGGDIVISTEDMATQAGSLPSDLTFKTTGAHPVIDGTTVPCFAAGTRLATPAGEIAVENLVPGDAVLTLDGHAETITWIGTRTVACHAHPRPEKVWPVRVRRHAFGPNLPKRDLILSPDHSIFVEGVLIPVCELVNGSSVVQERVHSIRYLHVECALHTIIIAEGLPAESLLDLGDHRQFENGEGPISLHADFTALAWEASCVPLKLHGPEVDAARALLARNAADIRVAA